MKPKALALANEHDWGGQLQICCRETKQRMAWNDACRAGWVADLNGEPFNAYYSPEGLRVAQERANK